MTESRKRFLGKYRGQVSNNNDPLKVGRIKATVSDVFGNEESGWALPCFALAAPGQGLFIVPPQHAWVWIEFEHGNPEKPIWTGCFFPADPAAATATVAQLLPLVGVEPNKIALKTAEWLITIESSKLVIASLAGPVARTRIQATANDIKLTNEQAPNVPSPPSATIEMSGRSVKINGNALEVT